MVCTDYVTKWVEAKALPFATENTLVSLIFLDILAHLCSKRNCNKSRNIFHIQISAEAYGEIQDQTSEIHSITSIRQWTS